MGEGIRRAGGGEEGKLGRKTGTAEVEAYEALPRRTGAGGDGGKNRLGTETGAGWNEGRNRWRRSAPLSAVP